MRNLPFIMHSKPSNGSDGYGVSLNFKNVVMLELSRFCSNEFLLQLKGAAPLPPIFKTIKSLKSKC